MENRVTVQSSLMPFSRVFTTASVENCKTIKDIVNKTIPYNFKDADLVCTLNGDVVDCELWTVTSVHEGDIVGLNFVPQGGGGGKSGGQILLTVAIIAAAVALPFAAAAAAAWAAGVGTAAAAWAAGGITAATYFGTYGAVMVAGSLVLSMAQYALLSTPKQSSGTNKGIAESATSFIEGASNSIDRYGVVPICLGTNRMFPLQAALPYTESSGKTQYSRQLFTYGYGKVMITDRKLGETDIDTYDEVEMEDRLDADLNQGVDLYANDVYQEDLSLKITKTDGYVTQTTQKNCNECEVDITFNGLCYYNDNGGKDTRSVQFVLQYAESGTENWSTGLGDYYISGKDFAKSGWAYEHHKKHHHKDYYSYETWSFYLNYQTGEIQDFTIDTSWNRQRYNYDKRFPSLSSKWVLLGYIASGHPTQFIDNRSNLAGKYIKDLNDFKPDVDLSDPSNGKVSFVGGTILGNLTTGGITVTDATSSTLRKTVRFKFPTAGQYDVRIERVTSDATDDRTYTDSYLTAIRSISYVNPVNFANISGTAMRIKATDQLSGNVGNYNAVVSALIKSYDPESGQWVDDQITSNPADIFRYVLQTPAFAKHLPDEKIDLAKLEEWWVFCDTEGLTYDRVIDYDTSVDDVLNDVCAAGVATLSKVNNIYSVIIDNERPIVKGLVTPRNSWDYKGTLNYPDLPHALRVEFRNSEAGYETDERIVYQDGYDETNAELYERLQFTSCTNADLAYWYGRRYYATAVLQPETHTFKMDFENMTFNRGDRISLVNDVILVGVGQGRIKELLVDDVNNPTVVKGFTLDDYVTIPSVFGKLGVRIRNNNGSSEIPYYLLKTQEGETNEFEFETPLEYDKAPVVGSLCAFVEDGKELDLIITGIKVDKNQAATITAIDYAPARFTPLDEIPDFVSNITISEDFYKPKAPVLLSDVKTDETVMIRNSDGSLTSVADIALINNNEDSVTPIVYFKRRDTTEWTVPTMLKIDPNEVIVSGLEDGQYYDFQIRYQRQTGLQLVSDPLTISNVFFIGGSNPPKKVQNFRVTVTNGLALFEWAPNDDIDISHYVIRFSSSLEDVSWENSQVAMDKITSTSITNIIHKGVYLIKAVDVLGNESEEATTIVSTETGAFKNVVEETAQQPLWTGEKVNTVVSNGMLRIENKNIADGYYYFDPETVDLDGRYECSLSANIKTVLEKRNRIRDIDFGIRDLEVNVRDFGASINQDTDWYVQLEMNVSVDGENWSGWETFVASQMTFHAIKFRLHLYSSNIYYTPAVAIAEVTVDMPDRYESAEDVVIVDPEVGAVVTYKNAFRNNPAVNITIQDGDIDDRLEFYSKNNKGFTFKIFNATINGYVSRYFDYLAAGYGKVLE